jgi:NTP pyrophosphatase (non-canonical NTP hydrolase)
VKSSDMLAYLESEVHELHEELSFFKSKGVRSDSSLSGNDLSSFHKKKEMIAELGDILFDALMLEMLLRR